jgi:hypothetical protein
MWLTLGIALLMYILKKKDGASDGEAALWAAGAGAAAYYTVEPTNEDAIWGDASREFFGMDPIDPSTIGTTGAIAPSGDTSVMDTIGTFGGQLIDGAGNVLKSWGPTGTAGVVLAGGVVSGGLDTKWIWLGAAALGIYLLAKPSSSQYPMIAPFAPQSEPGGNYR